MPTASSTIRPSDHPTLWTAGVEREVLPNGLTVLAQRDDSAPVAAVVTYVRAGFFDEPDEWAGLSHVLEHMFFKGTPTRGVGAVARETKGLGGYLNAGTGYDRTSYYVVVPSRNLARAIDIQADALQRATLDPGELARELQVIIEEAKRKRDTPSAVASETLHELLFDRHRIRRWRIGHEEALARFSGAELRAYYTSRYVPARTIVSIVAAVPVAEMLAAARSAYGNWPAHPADVPAGPTEPFHTGVRVRTLRGDVAQADLVLGWRGVPPLDPDEAALDLAATVLATGRGSRLHARLRETGIATSVGAWHYSQDDVGVFAAHVDGDPARVPEMLDGIANEVQRLRREGPGAAELDRARTLLKVRWARQFESYEGRASALAGAEALGGVRLVDEEYSRMLAVSPEDVRRATLRYLDPDAVSAVAYLPRGRGEDLDAGRSRAAFDPSPSPILAAPAAEIRVPPARPVTGRSVAGVEHVRLPGADLLLRRRPGTPLVTLGAYFPRRGWETAADAGIAALTMRSLIRGAGDWDAAQLALASERLGGSLNPVTNADWVGLAMTATAERGSTAAALLHTVLTAPRFDAASVGVERDLLFEEARQQVDDMFRYPFQLAFRGAFGDGGYGLPVGGTLESIPRLDATQVRGWHRSAVLGVRPVIVAVGDSDFERLAGELAGVFGDWAPGPVAGRAPAPEWQARGSGSVQVVSREKRQTAIAMAFPGPERRAADRAAAEVWAAVASGLGGRLFEALRDRRSLAYTVLASAWARASGGALVTYIATTPEREDEARAEMLAELAKFTVAPPTGVELRQAQNFLGGQAEVARQSASALASEMVEAWIAGRGLEELEDPGAEYRAVTAEEVLAVAREHLDPSRRSEGVVRGRSSGRG